MNNESGVEKGGRVAALGLSGVGVPTALEKSDASFTSVDGKTEGERSYFESSVAAYALGLGLCFIVNYVSKAGQPGKNMDWGIEVRNAPLFVVILKAYHTELLGQYIHVYIDSPFLSGALSSIILTFT